MQSKAIISSESWCHWREHLTGPARASIRAALLQSDPPPARGPDAAARQSGPKPVAIQRSGASQDLCATPDFAQLQQIRKQHFRIAIENSML